MRNDGAELKMAGRAATNPTISGAKGDRVWFRMMSTERRYDDAAGEWVDGDEFSVFVVAWSKLGASVLQMVRKGDPILLEGRMVTRKFERNGATEYSTECKAEHIAIDVARAAGRIKRDPAGVPDFAPAAVAEGVGAGTPTVDPVTEVVDPFQESIGPAGTVELEPAF
jgi:single-strand DNA-binding protein